MAVGLASLLPSLSVDGALPARPWLRFHIPLIEPDVQISRIRLSDKTHAFAHGGLLPNPVRRTGWRCL